MLNKWRKKAIVLMFLAIFLVAIYSAGGTAASAAGNSGPALVGKAASDPGTVDNVGSATAGEKSEIEDENGEENELEDEDVDKNEEQDEDSGEDSREKEDNGDNREVEGEKKADLETAGQGEELEFELELDAEENGEAGETAEQLAEIQQRLAAAAEKLARDPADTGAYKDVARAYAVLGQWDMVAENAKKLLALQPGNRDAGLLLAVSLYRQGDAEGAMQLLQDIAEKEKDDSNVYEMQGELLELRGELEEALEKYERAAALNPADRNIFDRLGKTYQKLNKEGIKVFVDGKKPAFDVQPQVRGGRTLVPFRAMAESLGAQVSWDEAKRQVTVLRGDIFIQLTVESPEATVNDTPVTLEVPASLIDGRVMVPLRFISEGLNARVTWEPSSQMVIVRQQAE